jgi:hypothetical protein
VNALVDWAVASVQTGSGLWSLVTMAASWIGLWLGGYNPRWGWWVGLPTQVLWIVGGVVLDRPGDIILSVIFMGLYVRNLRRTAGQSMAVTTDVDGLRAEVAALRARLEQCPDRTLAGVR